MKNKLITLTSLITLSGTQLIGVTTAFSNEMPDVNSQVQHIDEVSTEGLTPNDIEKTNDIEETSESTEPSSESDITVEKNLDTVNHVISNRDVQKMSEDDEPIDTWMPDKNLQKSVMLELNVSTPEQITKKALEDYPYDSFTLRLGAANPNEVIQDLAGLEYLKVPIYVFLSGTWGGIITTDQLKNLLFEHDNINIKHINFYGWGQQPVSIDFYDLLKGTKFIHDTPITSYDTYWIDITGRQQQVIDKDLIIQPSSFQEGGQLAISLKDFGLWSSDEYKLFNPGFTFMDNSIIIMDGKEVLATYKFKNFDFDTQSFIYDFDSENSKPSNELEGKKVNTNYLYNQNQNGSIPTINNFSINGFSNGSSNVIYSQIHTNLYFNNIIFDTPPIPAIEYTVTFDTNGGSTVDTQVVKDNEKVTKPSDPIKPGYSFKEWQLNGEAYDFNTIVKGNLTLKAIYTKNDITKPINSNGSNINNTENLPETGEKESILFFLAGIITSLASFLLLNKRRHECK